MRVNLIFIISVMAIALTSSMPEISAQTQSCPPPTKIVDIKASDNPEDSRTTLIRNVKIENTMIRLGPGVDLDFGVLPDDNFPIRFGRCVILKGVSSFSLPIDPTPSIKQSAARLSGDTGGPPTAPPGRTAQSFGPVIRFSRRTKNVPNFFYIPCEENVAPGEMGDGVRITGFRLYGPDMGQQEISQIGIQIYRCVDVEISNMEIAGWGESAITVVDESPPSAHGPLGRIFNPQQVRIHDNFIHHNQHPTKTTVRLRFFYGIPYPGLDRHASGYGVMVNDGAWAHIFRNVFDFNRHSIAASGHTGGYRAEQNLVLKGGGYHGAFFTTYTHSFDVHGTGCRWSSNLCGKAGQQFWYTANAFQYRRDNAIKIRGKPELCCASISENIFPHPGFEADEGDDAVHLNTRKNVLFGTGNIINTDSFGQYEVCDFDGDSIDDLFLPTGATWWFSSYGEFHWTYLNAKTERLDKLKLGYFDDDLRCDVLAQQDDRWVISSGGTDEWRPFGSYGVGLDEVRFGRFDPGDPDSRPGATRRTTHAFWRRSDGQWFVRSLASGDWTPVASSGFLLNELRFGDFTGDGVTDVLAVENGRWAISESAAGPWRELNPVINTPVANLLVANMDTDDNIDDLLRLEPRLILNNGIWRGKVIWWRSKNGIERWQRWKEYDFVYKELAKARPVIHGFAGRFGKAPGGGTVVIDPDRFGQFYSQAEIAVNARPDWRSVFPY